MYKFLLLDLDDTILDFQAAEAYAITQVLERHGFTASEPLLKLYARINKGLWERLERREVLIDEVLHSRFELFFKELDTVVNGAREETFFRQALNSHAQLIPDARRLLEKWHRSFGVYAVSNGLYETQLLRLDKAGITGLFHGLYISEQIGVNKPDPRFFDHVAGSIPAFDRRDALIVGDSLTSDIKGGKQAGITTCWFNRFDQPAPDDPSLYPDFEIRHLTDLDRLLEG